MAATPPPLPPYGAITIDKFQTEQLGAVHQIGEVYFDPTTQCMRAWTGNEWTVIQGPPGISIDSKAKALKNIAQLAYGMGEKAAKQQEQILKYILEHPEKFKDTQDIARKKARLSRFDFEE